MLRTCLILVLGACTSPPASETPSVLVQGDVAIANVAVVDPANDRTIHGQTIVVRSGKIVHVGPSAEVRVSATAKTIDGTGLFAMPGLSDMHVHVHMSAERDFRLLVAHGVTHVRNMFGAPFHLQWRKTAQTKSDTLMPSITTSGAIVDGSPPIWPMSAVVTTADNAAHVVTKQAEAGYDFIKVYSMLSRDAYDGIVAAAKRHKIPVAGHVPLAVPVRHALASGQLTIEHLEGYLPQLYAGDATKVKATSYPQFLRQLLDKARMDGIDELAQATAAAGTYNCPTLVVIDSLANLDRPEILAIPDQMKYVPAFQRERWKPGNDPRTKSWTKDDFDTMRDVAAFSRKVVTSLHRNGAPLLAGTDLGNPYVYAGYSLHQELALLVDAGLPAVRALQAATSEAARALNAQGQFGIIAEGARADIVVVRADPREDIKNTRDIVGVLLRGTWLSRGSLDAILTEVAGTGG